MEAYGFNKDEARNFILNNKHNHITTTYYLILKKNIKNGINSAGDLCSHYFFDYLKNKTNKIGYKSESGTGLVTISKDKENDFSVLVPSKESEGFKGMISHDIIQKENIGSSNINFFDEKHEKQSIGRTESLNSTYNQKFETSLVKPLNSNMFDLDPQDEESILTNSVINNHDLFRNTSYKNSKIKMEEAIANSNIILPTESVRSGQNKIELMTKPTGQLFTDFTNHITIPTEITPKPEVIFKKIQNPSNFISKSKQISTKIATTNVTKKVDASTKAKITAKRVTNTKKGFIETSTSYIDSDTGRSTNTSFDISSTKKKLNLPKAEVKKNRKVFRPPPNSKPTDLNNKTCPDFEKILYRTSIINRFDAISEEIEYSNVKPKKLVTPITINKKMQHQHMNVGRFVNNSKRLKTDETQVYRYNATNFKVFRSKSPVNQNKVSNKITLTEIVKGNL